MIDRNRFIREAVEISVIASRSFSSLRLMEFNGVKYVWKKMKPNGPNNEVNSALLIESFKNYKILQPIIPGLLYIYEGWWDINEGCFNTILEYLDPSTGWKRMADFNKKNTRSFEMDLLFLKAMSILAHMASEGFCDYDPDPTNFMCQVTRGEVVVKMIDLDKIMKLPDLCKDRGHHGTWFSSRIMRMLTWYHGEFIPQIQFTKVVRL